MYVLRLHMIALCRYIHKFKSIYFTASCGFERYEFFLSFLTLARYIMCHRLYKVTRSPPSKSHTVNSAVFVPFLFFWLCYIIARSENRVETDVYFI